jgi:uncharacterized protein (TIGR00369 family)
MDPMIAQIDPFAALPPMTAAETDALWARARSIPMSSTLGIECIALARGRCTLGWTRNARYDGIYRSIHGGILMLLADSAGAFALLTVIDPDSRITTTEMNMRFLAPVRGRVFAQARVLKVGRSLCPIVADVVDEAGQLVGHAGMTYMRLGREPAAAVPQSPPPNREGAP